MPTGIWCKWTPGKSQVRKSESRHEVLEGRAGLFYEVVTNDPAMHSKTPGEDQIYLAAYFGSEVSSVAVAAADSRS